MQYVRGRSPTTGRNPRKSKREVGRLSPCLSWRRRVPRHRNSVPWLGGILPEQPGEVRGRTLLWLLQYLTL
jgi:hypothetical protein